MKGAAKGKTKKASSGLTLRSVPVLVSKRLSAQTNSSLTSKSSVAIKLLSLNSSKVNPSPDLRGAHNAVLPNIKHIAPQRATKTVVAVFDELLEGWLGNLPNKPPSEVRVFLSSTFSDMRTERNWLAKEAYPKLKNYCYNELGIDFSVVDMRWGVTDDAVNEHITEDLCVKEIANCQRVGLGPNFVAILGDRYGFRPIPSMIPDQEFNMILKEVIIYEQPKQDLLKQWYVRDDNAVPPVYLLQPISFLIPGFGDHRNESEAKHAREQWDGVMATLCEMLRLTADSAVKKGLMTAERRHDYYKSVTEEEIKCGIYQSESPKAHCLAVIRRFTGLDNKAAKENTDTAQRFIEIKHSFGAKTIDTEIEKLRDQVQKEKIPKYLGKDQIYHYQLPWQPEGVKPEKYEEHFNYARNFCGDFINGILTLINSEKHRLDCQIPMSEYYTDYNELLHHLHFCKNKFKNFRGQHDVLNAVQNYVCNSKNRAPLVIFAESGCGKTSVMAKIFQTIPSWFEKEGRKVTRVIRFLGTSPLSTNIYNVLRGIAGQTADNYEHIMERVSYTTMKGIIKYLPRFLRNISRITQDHIFILLDSVDQLSPDNKAYKMKWLPTDLPSNVHVIISMLPNYKGIFECTKQLGLPAECFIEVKNLQESTGKEIVHTYLKNKKRTLTAQQEALVMFSLQKMPNPLYLKLLLDRAVKWNSYTQMDGMEIAHSVRGAINHLFTDLENRFGAVLIGHTLGYITVGVNGLTEVELEDALSCDNHVLDEVYHYHNPPVEGIVRIPPVLWARVRNEITEYLTERSSQGKKTLFWYHRQFIEAAEDRYVLGMQGIKLHSNLAELYQCEGGMLKDITLSRRKMTIPDADRQITSHPLVSSNIRSLIALPYHLKHSTDYHLLKDIALCNLKFLMTKIKALGLETVLQDFSEATIYDEETGKTLYDSDLQIVQNCLTEMLRQNKKSSDLPAEILVRIPDDDYWLPYATKLVRECRIYLQEEGKPNVIPLFPCLYDKVALVDSVEDIDSVLHHYGDMLLVKCNTPTPQKKENNLQTYKLLDLNETSAKTITELEEHTTNLLSKLSQDGKFLYSLVAVNSSKKGGSTVTFSPMEFKLDVFNTDEKQKSSSTSFVIDNRNVVAENGGGDFDFDMKCFDVHRQNHMVLGCYGKVDVVILDLKQGGAVVQQYRVLNKRISSANHNQILVQGEDQKFLCCFFAQHGHKTVVVIESTDKESQWTTLNINSVDKPLPLTVQIPGSALYNRWALANDEKHFVLPVCDLNNTTRIAVFDVSSGKHNSIKLTEVKVQDVAVTSIGGLACYVLTEEGILVYDLMTQSHLSSVDWSVVYSQHPGRNLTVEDDAQSVYVAHEGGNVSAWKVEGWEHLGHMDFNNCGAGEVVGNIYLSNSDSVITVHSKSERVLLSMDQKSFLEQCKRNLQMLKTGRRDNQHDLTTLKTASVILFSQSDIQAELITCEPGMFQYWDLGSMEYERDIGYGKGFEDFVPHKVAYYQGNPDSQGPSKCLLYDNQHAVIIDVNKGEVDFKILVPGNGVLAATSSSDGFYIVTRTDNKVDVNLVDPQTGEICKSVRLKDNWKTVDVEVKATGNGKYLAFKVACTDKEWEIIRATEKKNGNMRISEGRYKLYGLDLVNATGNLIPCYRQMTKVTCLVDCFETWRDSSILLGRLRKITVWDIATGANDSKLVKGTRDNMYFRPEMIEDHNKDWEKICIGKTLCVQYAGIPGEEIVAAGSADGWLVIYGTDGLSVQENPGKTPNNNSPVDHVCVSPNGLWVASVTRSHVLKCWSVKDACLEIFNIKLNVKVKQITFDPSGEYLGVLGERNDKTNKVLLFHMLKGRS